MELTDTELFLAFRQAKLGLNQEQRGVGRISMARSQLRIEKILDRLRQQLVVKDGWFDDIRLGDVLVVPKNAEKPRQAGSVIRIGHDVPAEGAIDLRMHLYPSIEFAIVEILWLWRFGPAINAATPSDVYSNRLKIRYGEVDRFSRGPFGYWGTDYANFRDSALFAARDLLTAGPQRCVLCSFDLKDYYDNIDTEFLLSPSFLESLRRATEGWPRRIDVDEYLRATQSLLTSLQQYRDLASKISGLPVQRGIPIGTLTSRLIANAALIELDKYIRSRTSVRYYGRYVDDMLIVSNADVAETATEIDMVARFLPLGSLPRTQDDSALSLDELALGRPRSSFRIQSKKLKAYSLRGPRGLDFLGAIQRDLQFLSSERRAFVRPDSLGTTDPLASVVVGADENSPVQLLREADRLRIGRFAASTVIRNAEIGVELLHPDEAAGWCRNQLSTLVNIATDAEHWIKYLEYSFRALGVCVAAGDIETAQRVVLRLRTHLSGLATGRLYLVWNGSIVKEPRAAQLLRFWFERRLSEEFCASVPLGLLRTAESFSNFAKAVIGELWDEEMGVPVDKARDWIQSLFRADLRRLDREADTNRTTWIPFLPTSDLSRWQTILETDPVTSGRVSRIRDFLVAAFETGDVTYAGMNSADVLLMTKPPSQFDISYRWARAGRSVSSLIPTTNAIRGTNYPDDLVMQIDDHTVDISPSVSTDVSPVVVMLGNLPSQEAWLIPAANGRPVESRERLNNVARIVNRAVNRRAHTGENIVLLLPELSLPRRWFRRLAELAISREINLVAGLEYGRTLSSSVVNEAVGVFSVWPRDGVVCVWPKTKPARIEHKMLLEAKISFEFHAVQPPLVVKAAFGAISTLICSELLDIELRAALLGRIDLLLVPCWNPDTATFEHELKTSAYDLHCYGVLANNGLYSDCRVQVPAKERFERDVCRLILPGVSESIAVRIDVSQLRQFQMKSLANPKLDLKKEQFMPLPPSYVYRRPVTKF